MKSTHIKLVLMALSVLFATTVTASEAALPSEVTLFKNVKVFNGTEDKLHDVDVLVVKNKIYKIAKDIPTSGSWEIDVKTGGAKQVKGPTGGTDAYAFMTFTDGKKEKKEVTVNVIDGGGRTLMPGLIDSHTHLNLHMDGTITDLESTTWEEIGARAVVFAQEMLANGFTTIRDCGGSHVGLKKVIDEGSLPGPRIYTAGAWIGQTAGHGEFSLPAMRKGESNTERLEITRIADGRTEITAAARRNIGLGAHFIKIFVSGGVTSIKDPLYGSQYSDDEVRAAIEIAEDVDTYVAVHVHQDADIGRALDLGALSIEHGLTISEENMKKLVEKGAFYSPNLPGVSEEAKAHPMHQDPTFPPTKKFLWLIDNSKEVNNLIRKYEPKLVWNTDYVLLTGAPYRAALDFTKFVFANEFGNFWALKSLTSTPGELAMLTGKHNPYPDGKLGVIEEGAYADLLIVDGNPLEDFTVIGANNKWFDAEPRDQDIPTIRIIMKDGKIYKNTL